MRDELLKLLGDLQDRLSAAGFRSQPHPLAGILVTIASEFSGSISPILFFRAWIESIDPSLLEVPETQSLGFKEEIPASGDESYPLPFVHLQFRSPKDSGWYEILEAVGKDYFKFRRRNDPTAPIHLFPLLMVVPRHRQRLEDYLKTLPGYNDEVFWEESPAPRPQVVMQVKEANSGGQ